MSHHLLTPGVWYTDFVPSGDRPVLGLVSGQRGSLLIDGGNSPAQVRELLDLAQAEGLPALRGVLLTHWHWDHCFGAVSTGLPVFAQESTKARLDWMRELEWTDAALARRVEEGTEMEFCRENIRIEWPDDHRKIQIPQADVSFGDWLTVDLGGLTAQVLHVESDHTPDCCVVHLPEPSVVFLGDSLYLNMDHEPWYRTRKRTLPLLEQLLALDAQWYLPAHHEFYTRETFRDYVFYQRQIAEIVGDARTDEALGIRFRQVFGREALPEDWEEMTQYLLGNQKEEGF